MSKLLRGASVDVSASGKAGISGVFKALLGLEADIAVEKLDNALRSAKGYYEFEYICY